jgi:hypothetical protein
VRVALVMHRLLAVDNGHHIVTPTLATIAPLITLLHADEAITDVLQWIDHDQCRPSALSALAPLAGACTSSTTRAKVARALCPLIDRHPAALRVLTRLAPGSADITLVLQLAGVMRQGGGGRDPTTIILAATALAATAGSSAMGTLQAMRQDVQRSLPLAFWAAHLLVTREHLGASTKAAPACGGRGGLCDHVALGLVALLVDCRQDVDLVRMVRDEVRRAHQRKNSRFALRPHVLSRLSDRNKALFVTTAGACGEAWVQCKFSDAKAAAIDAWPTALVSTSRLVLFRVKMERMMDREVGPQKLQDERVLTDFIQTLPPGSRHRHPQLDKAAQFLHHRMKSKYRSIEQSASTAKLDNRAAKTLREADQRLIADRLHDLGFCLSVLSRLDPDKLRPLRPPAWRIILRAHASYFSACEGHSSALIQRSFLLTASALAVVYEEQMAAEEITPPAHPRTGRRAQVWSFAIGAQLRSAAQAFSCVTSGYES